MWQGGCAPAPPPPPICGVPPHLWGSPSDSGGSVGGPRGSPSPAGPRVLRSPAAVLRRHLQVGGGEPHARPARGLGHLPRAVPRPLRWPGEALGGSPGGLGGPWGQGCPPHVLRGGWATFLVQFRGHFDVHVRGLRGSLFICSVFLKFLWRQKNLFFSR